MQSKNPKGRQKVQYTINNAKKLINKTTNLVFPVSLLLAASATPATNDLIVGRDTAIHITESTREPYATQTQEGFVVASPEKVWTAFLESEPQYEHIYRRLADI